MAKNDQLVRRAEALPQPVTDEMPEWLDEIDSRAGFENVTSDDQLVPRLALCQSMTPQRKSTNANYIADLQEGDFFHSVKGTVYGPGPLIITPIFMFKSALNMDGDGNMICRSDDALSCPKFGKCKCEIWGVDPQSDDSIPPECSKLYNFPVILYGEILNDFLILTFKSTSVKVMKQWISKMKSTYKPMFATAWKITSVPDKKDKYEFFNMKLEPAGWAPKEVYVAAEKMYTTLKGRELKVDIEGLDDIETGKAAKDTNTSEM